MTWHPGKKNYLLFSGKDGESLKVFEYAKRYYSTYQIPDEPKSSTGKSRDIGKITNSSECPNQSIAEIKAIKDKIDGVFVIIKKLCYSTTRLLNEFSAILARKDLVDSATQTDFEVHNNVGVNISRNVGQDGGHDKKLRNKMASYNARISIGI